MSHRNTAIVNENGTLKASVSPIGNKTGSSRYSLITISAVLSDTTKQQTPLADRDDFKNTSLLFQQISISHYWVSNAATLKGHFFIFSVSRTRLL